MIETAPRAANNQEFRRTYIGGSDAAPIAGVGLWASPYSVWAEKVGEVVPDPLDQSERMLWGQVLERPVAQEWARREGVTSLRSSAFRRHPTIPYIGGHPDFLGDHPVDGEVLIETKLSDRASQWEGPDGADTIPLQYFLQVQHYLLTTGIRVGFLVVLVRGNELRSWRIEADPEVQAGMIAAYADFWALVESRTPPEVDGHEATAEVLKRRYPREEDIEIVGQLPEQGLVEELLSVRRSLKEAEAQETLIVNRLKERMGKAARLLVPGVTITWKANKERTVTDWESLARGYCKVIAQARDRLAGIVGAGSGVNAREVLDSILQDGYGTRNLEDIEGLYTTTTPGARPFRVTLKAEE